MNAIVHLPIARGLLDILTNQPSGYRALGFPTPRMIRRIFVASSRLASRTVRSAARCALGGPLPLISVKSGIRPPGKAFILDEIGARKDGKDFKVKATLIVGGQSYSAPIIREENQLRK